LRFTLDYRDGGLLYSQTVQNLRSNGLAAETAVNREQAYIDTQAFIENEDGTVVPNNIPTNVESFWQNYATGGIAEGGVFDASFLKLREIGLFYTFPAKWLEKSPLQSLSFGLEARNLAIIYSSIPHIDPETNLFGAANDGAGIEFNSPPTARSFGANLRVRF